MSENVSFDPMSSVTVTAPTNIACIKYWGKDDVKLNTPINSSLSVTLSQKDLRAMTSVVAHEDFEADRLWLNGKEEDLSKNKRMQAVLSLMREYSMDKFDSSGKVMIKKEELSTYKVRIASKNSFPTAAGLASSAAGYACLVYALSKVFNVNTDVRKGGIDLTVVARQGSGSASRSLYGGFVKWEKGVQADGLDSKAVQVADRDHWPEMEALILIVCESEKDTPSTQGMQNSVATSPLLKHRAEQIVAERMEQIEKAIKERDFETFGKITMQESNQFHACCLDSFPPIFYMNETSKMIIKAVHMYNAYKGAIRAAYTYDAGPNAVIYFERGEAKELLAFLLHIFPPTSNISDYINDVELATESVNIFSPRLPEALQGMPVQGAGAVSKIIYTSVGTGPCDLPTSDCLLDPSTGKPFEVRNQ